MAPTIKSDQAAELYALREALADEKARRESIEARLREALERQTATAEILKAISSSPTDVQPVFDAIARNAQMLCNSTFANVFRYDGKLMHYVASHLVAPEQIELVRQGFPAPPSFPTRSGRNSRRSLTSSGATSRGRYFGGDKRAQP